MPSQVGALMESKHALTTSQAAAVVVAILVVAAAGSYALVANAPPKTLVQTQVQTQTQIQTQVQTITQVQKLKSVTMLLGFLPSAAAAHYYVAKGLGFYADEGLDVTIIPGRGGTFAANNIEIKQVTFSETPPINIYQANAKGAKIRMVLQIYYVDPGGIATWKDKNVKTPKDLEGLKFASAAGSSIVPVLKAVMPLHGASFDKVVFLPVEITAQRPLFLRGEADFIPSFWHTDKPVLEKEVAKLGREVVHYLMADWGYKVYSTGVIAHLDTIKEDRDVVERFVRATVKGLQATKENPERAADLILKFEPGLDRETLLLGIQFGWQKLFDLGAKLTDARIKETMEFIEKWGSPDRKLTPEEIWDFSLVQRQ